MKAVIMYPTFFPNVGFDFSVKEGREHRSASFLFPPTPQPGSCRDLRALAAALFARPQEL